MLLIYSMFCIILHLLCGPNIVNTIQRSDDRKELQIMDKCGYQHHVYYPVKNLPFFVTGKVQ